MLIHDSSFRQLARQTQMEQLLDGLHQWSERSSTSRVMRLQQQFMQAVLSAAPELLQKAQAPLVIATFGGTGVGKSTLMNALVGAEVTLAGVTRPTTRIPTLICHPETSLTSIGLTEVSLGYGPLREVRIEKLELPILKQFVLLDLPDVDTDEDAADGSNLARVRALLPLCDVLLVVSTQEKYRQARLKVELRSAVTQAKVIFVQTFADRDDDIRDHWQKADLNGEFDVTEMFFVDSLRAMEEQKQGLPLTGDFSRLKKVLEEESITGARPVLRMANLVDLLRSATTQSLEALDEQRPFMDRVSERLDAQDQSVVNDLTEHLREALQAEQQPWEERLIATLAESWTLSPLTALLRLRSRWSTFLGSYALLRSRTVVQATIAGSFQAMDWYRRNQKEGEANAVFDQVALTSLTEGKLRNLATVLEGDVHRAGLDAKIWSIESLRQEAAGLQIAICQQARDAVETIIRHLLSRNAGAGMRLAFEALLLAMPVFLIGRVAWNFFYESFWLGRPYLETSFYIPASLFFVAWCGLVLWLVTRRLKKGLPAQIQHLAKSLAEHQIPQGLFHHLRQQVADFDQQTDELRQWDQQAASLQNDLLKHPTRLSRARHSS